MSSTQLSFALRASSTVRSVHLLGSWDNYEAQLPLSLDKASKSKSWKGTFRFPPSAIEPGQRYWYYYIIDGYHCAHDPSEPSINEPTTGRELNVLDVPRDKGSRSSSSKHGGSSSSKSSSGSSRHSSKSKESSKHRGSHNHHMLSPLSIDVPKGRPLSTSQIQAPKPISPHAARHILDERFADEGSIDELTSRLGSTTIYDDETGYVDFTMSPGADASCASPSMLSSSPSSSENDSDFGRSDSSSPSNSGYSTPGSDYSNCTCERYGITRKGERVKLVCGGTRCGGDASSCSSDSGSEDDYAGPSRRNGMLVR
jgi:hypothetical protein